MRWMMPPIRSRQGVVCALLVVLVALFTVRATVHHAAEDAAPASAISHHEDAHHGFGVDVAVGIAIGTSLLATFLAGIGTVGSPPRVWRSARRHPRSAPPTPRPWIGRALRRADLQCFLT